MVWSGLLLLHLRLPPSVSGYVWGIRGGTNEFFTMRTGGSGYYGLLSHYYFKTQDDGVFKTKAKRMLLR